MSHFPGLAGFGSDRAELPRIGARRYYCVYDQKGAQVGHVSIDNLAAEQAANPDLRYEPSRVALRFQRAAEDAWEREQLDRAETDREARVALAEARNAADRLAAEQAAAEGKVICAHCECFAGFAEPCWSCGAADTAPGEGTDEPRGARLYELSVAALEARGSRSGEAA